jgi:hypothetical protein
LHRNASLKGNLVAARERVVALVSGKGDIAALKPEIATLSAKVDAEAASVPGFKPLWDQLEANRDAKALAGGEQKQLFEKMLSLLE